MIEMMVFDFHALSWLEADGLTFSEIAFKFERLLAHMKKKHKQRA